MSLCCTLIKCDIRPCPLPKKLNECLRSTTLETPDSSDEEISTSCLFAFMWRERDTCGKSSTTTERWLSSLVTRFTERSFDGETKSRTVSGQRSIRSTRSAGTNLPVRKEYRMLTDQQRREYHVAVNALKRDKSVEPNKYDALVSYHQTASRAAHGGPAFLGWHRFYLVLYELALQEKNPDVTIPYWDSSLDLEMDEPTDSVIWTSEFLGNGRGEISSGPFSGWTFNQSPVVRSIDTRGDLVNRTKINRILRTRRLRYFVDALEQQHNNVHGWVGGNMVNVFHSPSDPVFYMHHAYIDCLWEEYRKRQKRWQRDPTKYPRVRQSERPDHNPNRLMQLPQLFNKSLTNNDGYKNFWTEDFYRCAARPWCSIQKPNCGSKWLKCDLFLKRCVSKGSIAIQPDITPDKMIQIAKIEAPEQPEVQPAFNSGMFVPKETPEMESTFSDVSDFAKGVSTKRFFDLLNKISKPEMSPAKTMDIPHMRSMHAVFPTILTLDLKTNSSIDDFKIPIEHTPCTGYPPQNTFSVDCQISSYQWVFVPVKIVHLRHGDILYDSHPVDVNGKLIKEHDIYQTGEPLQFAPKTKHKQTNNHNCHEDKSGLTKVKITSYGLNYHGFYEDYVFLDNRQSVSSSIGYVAVNKPGYRETNFFVSAIEDCGMMCQPYILKQNHKNKPPVYSRSTGAYWLNDNSPVYHGLTYRGAEALVWNSRNIPFENNRQIPILFYCNNSNKKPWS